MCHKVVKLLALDRQRLQDATHHQEREKLTTAVSDDNQALRCQLDALKKQLLASENNVQLVTQEQQQLQSDLDVSRAMVADTMAQLRREQGLSAALAHDVRVLAAFKETHSQEVERLREELKIAQGARDAFHSDLEQALEKFPAYESELVGLRVYLQEESVSKELVRVLYFFSYFLYFIPLLH